MKSALFKLICFVFPLFACNAPQKTDNLSKADIAIEVKRNAQIHFSDIFEQVEYIPLETTDTCLVGTVERLRIFDDKVCILCDKSLLIFNIQNGKSELKLSKLGSAPEEYQSVYDVYIDKKESCIELLDMNGKKIQKYDMSGKFKSSLSLPFMSFSFTKQKKSNYWFYNNNLISDKTNSKVIHYDADNKRVINQYFPINPHLSEFFFVMEGNNFTNQKDGILFFACPSDTIYSLKEKPRIAYTFNLGRHRIPDEFYNRKFSDIMDFSKQANKREYVYFINNFSANNEYLLLSFLLDKEYFWNLYDIEQQTNYTGNILEDDIHKLSDFPIENPNTLFAINKECLYFLISASQFIETTKKNKSYSQYVREKNISEEHNPILVKCRFKKKVSNI